MTDAHPHTIKPQQLTAHVGQGALLMFCPDKEQFHHHTERASAQKVLGATDKAKQKSSPDTCIDRSKS